MNTPVRVVPAILTDDPKALRTMVRQAERFTDYVQLDFMDGKFVPSRSVTWADAAAVSVAIAWEAHIMVVNPDTHLDDFRRAGARKVIFHHEATATPQDVISRARQLGLKVGLAVNPETTVAAILPLLDKVDSVLLLAVHPGFYGAKFIPKVLDKVAELHRASLGLEVGVDGGIKENNIAGVARTGVNVIYVGSAIFRQPRPAESYRRLQAIANGDESG